jgi:hypothetical protein
MLPSTRPSFSSLSMALAQAAQLGPSSCLATRTERGFEGCEYQTDKGLVEDHSEGTSVHHLAKSRAFVGICIPT